MPYGDHIETKDLDGRLEHGQPVVVLAEQASRDERYKIVRLQDVWDQQETRHRVANFTPQPESSKCPIGRALEGTACR